MLKIHTKNPKDPSHSLCGEPYYEIPENASIFELCTCLRCLDTFLVPDTELKNSDESGDKRRI